MKRILLIAALIGFSFSSFANTIDGTKSRTTIENGVKTVTTQQVYDSSKIEEKVASTVKMLETAFQSKAKVCSSANNCYYDFSSSNGDTARLLIDKKKGYLLLVTKKAI